MSGLRRWVSRGLFLLLLLLCVGGWGWSVKHFAKLSCGIYERHVFECHTRNGAVYLHWVIGFPPGFIRNGVYFSTSEEKTKILSEIKTLDFYWLWNENIGGDTTQGFIAVPYWFLILVVSLALFYVWRQTRHQPSSSRAFPVEISNGAS